MSKTLIVGMADMNMCQHPDVLTTIGLGSCVGVALYDPASKIGGLVHVMLPLSTSSREAVMNKAKYADIGTVELYNNMLKLGARRNGIVAKIAGGAHMFSKVSGSDVIKVGARNVEVSKKILQRLNVPLRGEDTGGTYGRTIELHTETGDLLVKTIGHGQKII